jgi:hypothetical protein
MERLSLKSAPVKLLGVVVLATGLFTAGIVVGRMSQTPEPEAVSLPTEYSPDNLPIWRISPLVQDDAPERDPNDPRELIPMPGPGQQQGEGGQQPQECGIYLYQDGQLYQLQPGQQLPGQGDGSPELIPLNPVPGGPGGPSAPSAPPPPPGIES